MTEEATPAEQTMTPDAPVELPVTELVTGNSVVDRVVSSLGGLAEVPVDDHVAIFERAHEQLRSALDGPRMPRP